MYHPTTRVLAVLALLQSHGRLTGADMARRLEVNIRTLRRYITILQDLGIPISGERGRNGSYELMSGHKLPPMMFTNDEALVLAIGLLTARRLGITETSEALESAQAKLEKVMPLELKARLRALIDTVTLDLTSLPQDSTISSSHVLITMSSAAQYQRRVHMQYRSRADDSTERDFDPYGLAYKQGCWYAVGWCHLRHGLRSFRLDRITQIDMTDTRFARPDTFDALDHLVKGVALLPRHYTIEVLLHTDLATAQRDIQETVAVLEPHPDGVLMRGSTDDLEWMARMLSKVSFSFVIHTPDELRDALRQRAKGLLEMADRAN